MFKYIKCYYMGYEEGVKDAVKFKKDKEFKRIKDKEIKSKLYDIGYIEGYKFIIKNIFKKK